MCIRDSYVRLDDFRYVTPPEIEAIPEAKAAFLASMEEEMCIRDSQ